MLDGAIDGIIFYIRPQWKELLNLKVWYAAIPILTITSRKTHIGMHGSSVSLTPSLPSWQAFFIFTILGSLVQQVLL